MAPNHLALASVVRASFMLPACRAVDVAIPCVLPELHPSGLLWLVASGALDEPGKILDAFFLTMASFFFGFAYFLLPVSLPSCPHGDLGKLNHDARVAVASFQIGFRLHDRYRRIQGLSRLVLWRSNGRGIGRDTVWCRRRRIPDRASLPSTPTTHHQQHLRGYRRTCVLVETPYRRLAA